MKKPNFRKWCDEWVLAGKGILLACRQPRFWVGFAIAFLFFGTLMNLLSGGMAKFQLMGALGMPQALLIIWDAVTSVFGIGVIFIEWLPIFLLALLQGVLIGLIVLLWDKKRARVGEKRANVEKAGIITGLIALGAGCPTCGATLLTPLLGAIFSTGGMAIAGTISGIVTAVAVVVALLSLKRIGEEAYVIIVNEKYLAKKREVEVEKKVGGKNERGGRKKES